MPASGASGAVGAAGAASSATILLVEDDPPVRAVILKVLCRAGYRVLDAQDGEEALQRASDQKQVIDILLTDIVMPRLGGLELASRMRAGRPGLRVLFISGHAEQRSSMGDLDDSTRFLLKPFAPGTLISELAFMLPRPSPSLLGR